MQMDAKSSEKFHLIGAHVRAARALLDWDLQTLARLSGVTKSTLHHWEREKRNPRQETQMRVRDAFEKAGIVFSNGGSPGVRLFAKEAHKADDNAGLR